jgi:predicted DNA-binding protein (UPF0278 family)
MTVEEVDEWVNERRKRVKALAADLALAVLSVADNAGIKYVRTEHLPAMLERVLKMVRETSDGPEE